ncbi:hypothetical protein [Psychrobacter sp. M13]|uniref:hypothetical protein n=1 Tax=Psychrobacter sp. M13 TaxID=3067275 RepID=UPI00273BE908|nr:hypothetical protein [Psychrobacter sp. M13]WLP94630.1 hypothetical protein Q9G97_00455 [Psychrobacter sp. M13]
MSKKPKVIGKLELATRIKELAKLVEDKEQSAILPTNIANMISERMDLEFSPVASYEKGGTYTKEGPPGSYTKGGTYTKSDFTKEASSEINLKDLVADDSQIGRDFIIQPGEIEGLNTPLRVSSVLKHPEVRERLRHAIESELESFKE